MSESGQLLVGVVGVGGGTLSVPGSAVGSEQFGAGAAATGAGSIALGTNSVADAVNCVVVGDSATNNGATDCTIIGDGASVVSGTSNNAVCVGSGASGEANSVQIGSQTTGTGVGSTFVGFNITGGTSGNAVIIGANSTSNNAVNLVAVGEGISGANSCVLIGRATSTAGTGTTALGNAATDTAVGGFGVAVGYLAQSAGGVTLGAQATSVATSSTSIGRQATGTGAGSTLIGKSTSDAGFAHVVAIGRLSTATKANQFVMGANGTEIVEVVIGEGAASASPQSQLLFTTTNGVGTDIHATDLVLQSGLSTGAGAATDIVLKTPDVGSTGATLQTAVTRLTLNETEATFTVPLSGPSVSKISNGTSITATDTADAGERMIYDPTGGTFQLNAPASPVMGTRWATKNRSASVVAVTISGNGSDIEDPTATFALAATFSLSGDGVSIEWEYDGTQWVVV